MSDFEHFTTIINGVDSDVKRFPIEESEIVRFSIHEVSAYATIVALVSHVHTKAQLLYEEQGISNPFRVSVIVEGSSFHKYKPTDADSKIERIAWFFRNAAAPGCGIITQIYINHKMKSYLDTPFAFNSLWHSKETNRGKISDYITLHPHSEIDWNSGASSHRREGLLKQIELCRELCEKHDIEIKEVDYTTSINEAYKLLLSARCHVGYIGSTHYLSAFTRTPCVTLGKHVPGIHPYTKPFGLTRTNTLRSLAPEYELDFGRMRVWNELGTPPGRTLLYNFEAGHMYQDEPRYYTMAEPSNLLHTEQEILRKIL